MSAQLAVERATGRKAIHLKSVPVIETFRGDVVWQGVVEEFTVANPPPSRAYGWAVEGASGPEYVAVLGTPPIDSPLAAVRAWIISQSKP